MILLFHLGQKSHNYHHTGDKNIQYCTCPAGRVTYNFHSSCKHNVMHLSFKSVCNKEHKGVICNTTSSSYFPKALYLQDKCFGKNYLSFLDFTHNYERTSGIFVPCHISQQCQQCIYICLVSTYVASLNLLLILRLYGDRSEICHRMMGLVII